MNGRFARQPLTAAGGPIPRTSERITIRTRASMPVLRPLLPVLAVLIILGCDRAGAAAGDAAGADSSAAAVDTGGSGPSNVSLPVVAEDVTDGDLILSVNTTGQVRSDAEARIRTEVAGRVDKVLIRPGDRVRKGQPLVQLDPRSFDLDMKDAEVAVKVSEAAYGDLYRPDSAITGVMPPQNRLDAFVIRSGLAAARLRLERAKLDRLRSEIVAPFDGVVDRVTAVPGDLVSGGAEVASIVDLRNLRIEAAVLEHDLPLIKIGGTAVITSAAAAGEAFNGRVVAVLPLVDSTTRAGRVFVRTTGTGALRPGMYADVRLEAQRLPNRRLVPTRAIIQRDGRDLVFVIKGGRAQWTYIQAGRSNGRQTEVLPDSASGLIPVNPGDQVIIEGHLTLTHDAQVRVVASRERTAGAQD
jgi:membrane fusion protein, multidrug efflux system